MVWCGGLKTIFLCTDGMLCGVGGRRPASSALMGMLCGVVWGVFVEVRYSNISGC